MSDLIGGPDTLNHALALAARGIPVFPCLPTKAPACAGGFKSAATNPETVRRLFAGGAPLIGVPTGEASGLDVLDLDPRHGSDPWWAANHANIPSTLIHGTRSGGKHLFFRHQTGLRSSTQALAPGCDVRADGGYVIWWPAAGFSVGPGEEPARWPAWVLAGLAARRESASTPDASRLAPPSAAAVVELLNRMPNPLETCRDTYIRVMLGASGCVQALDGADDGSIRDAAIEWATRWEGYDGADEAARWDDDFAHRSAPLAGWPSLQAVAAKLIPEYRAEQADAEFQAIPGAVAAPGCKLFYSDDPDGGTGRGYVIKHLIAPGDVCALLGQPGAGKSTLAPYLAYALAQGRAVFGMRTRPGRTLYAAAEDVSGFHQRLRALGRQHGHTRDCAGFECGNLRESPARAALLAAVAEFKPALLILDTLGAAFAGLDENSAADMGGVVAFARQVAATGCAVLLIHHPAKHGDGTPRGHSVLNGTLDMVLTLAPDDAKDANTVVRGSLLKNRNGTTGREIAFRRGVVELGRDEDGEAITTTLPVELDGDDAAFKAARLPAQQAKALQALRVALDGPGAVQQRGDTAILESTWRAECDARSLTSSDNPDSQGRTFRRAAGDLAAAGLVLRENGYVRLPGVASFSGQNGQWRTYPDVSACPDPDGQDNPLRGVRVRPSAAVRLPDDFWEIPISGTAVH